MTLKRKVGIILINLSVGCFAAYLFFASARETEISLNQNNIACEIIELDLRHGHRHHPKAYVVYQNKKYVATINVDVGNSLQVGFNSTTFFYDELLDRVFISNSGMRRGAYAVTVFFLLSFLLWLGQSPDTNKKKKWH